MLFPDQDENTLYLRRSDPEELLGSFSSHPFKLEGQEWPTVEHYFQAMKFIETEPDYAKKIALSKDAKQASKLGRKKKSKLRKDWSKVRTIVMTRALYTKCHAYPIVKEALLATNDQRLLENNQYDYFWGCGRDRRGENAYGKVLMDVRRKLLEEDRANPE